MLILSRHRNQEIVIRVNGEEIRLMVTDICGDTVKLGFTAPKHVTIHRLEVQKDIDRQGKVGA